MYRAKARIAATSAGVLPLMMEDFTASGESPPLEACIARVGDCDVLVAIVAHRYGWKPEGGGGKSVTWFECTEAVRLGREVLAFVVEDKCDWPPELKDSHRIAVAVERGNATAALLDEVQNDIAKLNQFKQWLDKHGVRATFTNPEELGRKVESALREWREHRFRASGPVDPDVQKHGEPAVYLDRLRNFEELGPLLKEHIRIQEAAINLWKWWIFGLLATGATILTVAQLLKVGSAVAETLSLGGALVGVLGVFPYKEMIPRKERLATYHFLLTRLSSPGLTEEHGTALLALSAEMFRELVKR